MTTKNKSVSYKERGLFGFIKRNPHLWLLLYWLVFFIIFTIAEKLIVEDYTVMYIPLDDKIPFCKWFAIPYVIWYPYIILPLAYLAFKNPPEFKREMWFVMLTYTVTIIIYFVFPNGQELRPPLELVQGKNPVDWWLRFLYGYDTNTNVMPSIHVIGTLAASFGLLHLKGSRKWWALSIIAVLTVSICLSIVFIKQHSSVDLFAALALCAVSYPIIYNKRTKEIAQSSALLPIKLKKRNKQNTI